MAKTLADIATGNAVPGGLSPVDQIDPELARRILWMHSEMPPNIAAKFNIISGYRSPARQAEVNPSVKDSQHTHRFAVDTTKDPEVIAWINATKGKYGVNYPLTGMRNEENHLEMMAPGGGRMRGLGGYAKAPSGYKSGLSRTPDSDTDTDITPSTPEPPAAPAGPPPDLAGDQAKLAAAQEQADARVAYLKAVASSQNNPLTSGANTLGSLLTQGMQPTQPEPRPIILPPGAPLPISRRIS